MNVCTIWYNRLKNIYVIDNSKKCNAVFDLERLTIKSQALK